MTIYAVLGLIILIGAGLWFVRKAGSDKIKAQVGEQNAKVAEKIADATADTPTSRDELDKLLRDSSRKL